ncbi:MAG: hypothetical protein ACRC6X_02835 [Culicoidibacterales bacterium]
MNNQKPLILTDFIFDKAEFKNHKQSNFCYVDKNEIEHHFGANTTIYCWQNEVKSITITPFKRMGIQFYMVYYFNLSIETNLGNIVTWTTATHKYLPKIIKLAEHNNVKIIDELEIIKISNLEKEELYDELGKKDIKKM